MAGLLVAQNLSAPGENAPAHECEAGALRQPSERISERNLRCDFRCRLAPAALTHCADGTERFLMLSLILGMRFSLKD